MDAKRLNITPLYVALIGLGVLAAAAVALKSAGLVLNVTGSMPDSLYKIGNGARESITSFCLPIPHRGIPRGACPDGQMALVKRVVGVAGDVVAETDIGVVINGHLVPNSRPLDLDHKGQALPHLRGVFSLKQGEIWVAGEHPNSFDSRYFGILKKPI